LYRDVIQTIFLIVAVWAVVMLTSVSASLNRLTAHHESFPAPDGVTAADTDTREGSVVAAPVARTAPAVR
jgi:hypothetical protein